MLRARPNKPRSEFAQIVAEVLATKGMDFAALAKRLEVASSSVYRVVRGQQRLPVGEDLVVSVRDCETYLMPTWRG